MEPQNIEEAKALIKRYNSITLDEIKSVPKSEFNITKYLTGFGSTMSCTLCKVYTDTSCCKCIYYTEGEEKRICCMNPKHEKTFRAIEYAKTPTKLRNAYRKRAKHIQSILDSL